jgi:hypothetical protein
MERFNLLNQKHNEVIGTLSNNIQDGLQKLDAKKAKEIQKKHNSQISDTSGDVEAKLDNIEKKFENQILSVEYYQKIIDTQSKGFKKVTQLLEKEEKAIDEEIKKTSNYNNYKDEYEKKRSE